MIVFIVFVDPESFIPLFHCLVQSVFLKSIMWQGEYAVTPVAVQQQCMQRETVGDMVVVQLELVTGLQLDGRGVSLVL